MGNLTSENLVCADKLSTRWIAPIARWSVWQAEESTLALPKIDFVEPSLRRKLSALAKISLKVANDCSDAVESVHFVYASRHGDLRRTTEMLSDLAEEEQLSPTTFSMSVLNAIAGIYSIAKNEKLPSTSLSAGKSSFGFGLMEACLQLANSPETPVLYVYSDEAVPPEYGAANEKLIPHAVALLLSKDAELTISCEMQEGDADSDSDPQSYAFLHCLNEKCSQWQGDGRTWTWNKIDH